MVNYSISHGRRMNPAPIRVKAQPTPEFESTFKPDLRGDRNMTSIRNLAVASLLALAAYSTPASAGGWIADNIIKPFNPNLAKQADQWNARNGNVVDHTIAAAANNIVPGSGAAL